MKRRLPRLYPNMNPHLRFVLSLLLLTLLLFGLLASLGCLGCFFDCLRLLGSCYGGKKTVSSSSGQFGSVADLQASRTLWEISRWVDPVDYGLDTETCQDAVDALRGDDVFVAVRVPGPVGEGAPSPLVTDEPYQGVVSIWTYGDTYGTAYEAGIRERPDMLPFIQQNLPSAPGDQWLALSVADDAPDCPDGLDLVENHWSLKGSIHLDLSDRPDEGDGTTIEGYVCFRGQSLPAGAFRGLSTYQGQGITCMGPDPLVLLDNPAWKLGGTGASVVTHTQTISFHHAIDIITGGDKQIDLALDSDLPTTWHIYGDKEGAPDLTQPLTSPITASDGYYGFWLVSDPVSPDVADGPYMLRVTAALWADPGATQVKADSIWVGDWVPPTDGYQINLPLTMGD